MQLHVVMLGVLESGFHWVSVLSRPYEWEMSVFTITSHFKMRNSFSSFNVFYVHGCLRPKFVEKRAHKAYAWECGYFLFLFQLCFFIAHGLLWLLSLFQMKAAVLVLWCWVVPTSWKHAEPAASHVHVSLSCSPHCTLHSTTWYFLFFHLDL